MKNRLTKAICVLASLFLISIVFSGCISEEKNKDKNNFTKHDIEKYINSKPITIGFSELPPGYERISDEIAKRSGFLVIFKKVGINLNNSSANLGDIEKILSSDEHYDALCVNGSLIKGLADRDIILDISSIFPNSAPKYYSRLGERELQQVKYNQLIYAIPPLVSQSSRPCVVVRQDLMDKYGISNITSFDDFEIYLKEISRNEKNLIPVDWTTVRSTFFIQSSGYVLFDGHLVYKWDDPDMHLKPWEQTDDFVNAISTIARWYKEGYVLRRDGEFASFITTLTGAYKPDERWEIYPLNTDRVAQKYAIDREVLVINKNSQNAEFLLQFIEWVHLNQSNNDLLTYGIEGIDYSLVDNVLVRTENENIFTGLSVFSDHEYWHESPNYDAQAIKKYKRDTEYNTMLPPHTGFRVSSDLLPKLEERNQLFYSEFNLFKDVDIGVPLDDFKVSLGKIIKADELQILQNELNMWR